jgi:hypothetical protein
LPSWNSTRFVNCSCVGSERAETVRTSFSTVVTVRQGLEALKIRAKGRAWCLRLGMTASSWDGWARLHVNPTIQMGVYFLTTGLYILSACYILTALPFNNSTQLYLVTVPFALHTFILFMATCLIWRLGPQFVQFKYYPILLLLILAGDLPMLYVGYIGPIVTVPWQNRLRFVCIHCIATVFLLSSAACGGVPGEHPVEPRTSIIPTLSGAVIQSLWASDSLTDLALITALLEEVWASASLECMV